jgi:hypothetical protein
VTDPPLPTQDRKALQASPSLALLQIALHRTHPDAKTPGGFSLGLTGVHRPDNAFPQVKRIRTHTRPYLQLTCLARPH